ncbi:MAG: hypothetical protein QF908_00400 [Dehalococcoidia bacterium]|jgi:hypothetical protein|nr:hypothetical protein [Chloroflexota bacterium]MDP7232050.1 hypothetical protein [Dehalococcoidia bacterium]MDP7612425.1 hypothetical protein [Dehalococcoidia bacterium]|tara:strand:- start:174 stop:647 length:474 start_codon:yes stop_codon:yes gene_type:complete
MKIFLSFFFIILIACNGENELKEKENPIAETMVNSSHLITRNTETFTTDSFIKAGWKKSKQYDTETVPNATEIWYGFYNRKDIEIRFYDNHQEAIEFGIPAAEASIEGAVKRSKGGKLLDFSGGSFSGYADYLIAGNAILLCEMDLSACELLMENVD